MTPYSVETMSRRELRKCCNRYAIAVMLLFPLGQMCAYGLLVGLMLFSPGLMLGSPEMHPVLSLVNAIASYVPTAAVFLLLLRRFPRCERLKVDRLSLWELMQAAVFALGICCLFNLLTLAMVKGLEMIVGLPGTNRIVEDAARASLWDQVVFTMVIPAVCEELLFRKLLLNRLRPLGDVLAVFLSALAFALFHANFYQLFYTFVLGVFFAVVVLLTGSVRDTILLHMIINGSTVLADNIASAWFSLGYGVFLNCAAIVSVVLLVKKGRQIHFEPGPLALSGRDKRRACLRSVCFWVMLVEGLALSIYLIFQ
jgi:membrane protease YdiL (CAAX protease family)